MTDDELCSRDSYSKLLTLALASYQCSGDPWKKHAAEQRCRNPKAPLAASRDERPFILSAEKPRPHEIQTGIPRHRHRRALPSQGLKEDRGNHTHSLNGNGMLELDVASYIASWG